MSDNFKEMYKYEIYIGLKDQFTYEEKISRIKFQEFLEEYCKENKIDFSIQMIRGGYKHNMGYVTENSMLIMLIGTSFDQVLNISNEAKTYVNTDTIMLTKEKIECQFI